jgi:hypothetical protein
MCTFSNYVPPFLLQLCDGSIVAFTVLHNVNCNHGLIYVTSQAWEYHGSFLWIYIYIYFSLLFESGLHILIHYVYVYAF